MSMPAIGLAAFTAEDPLELSFAENEELTILHEPTPEGWLMAMNSAGAKGLVPETYITMAGPDGMDGMDGDDDFDDDIRDTEDGAVMFSGFLPMGRGRMLADFTAEQEGEMTVGAGDVVELLRPQQGLPEGWLYGRMEGREGLIPETYVEVRPSAHARRQRLRPRLPRAPARRACVCVRACPQPMRPGAPADAGAADEYGNDFDLDGYDDLGLAEDVFGDGGVPNAASGEMMLVLADFTAEDEKELSVRKGQCVSFQSTPPEAPDWAMCSAISPASGAGLVPATYICAAQGTMMADFTAEDGGEVSASTGARVWQIAPTPSSAVGWSSVVLESGATGLVPATYVNWFAGHAPFDGPAAGAADPYGDGEEEAMMLEEANLDDEFAAEEAADGGDAGGRRVRLRVARVHDGPRRQRRQVGGARRGRARRLRRGGAGRDVDPRGRAAGAAHRRRAAARLGHRPPGRRLHLHDHQGARAGDVRAAHAV